MISRRFVSVTVVSLVVLGSGACTLPPSTPDSPDLTGKVWELQQIQFNDGTLLVADPPQNYTAEFSEDGEVFVQADCNRSIGSFTDDGGPISIMMGATTLAACPPGSISNDFLQALNNASLYFFQEGDLFIDLRYDSGTMQFSAAEVPPLVGTVWQLQQIQYNDGLLLVANPPENYTLQFSDNGEVVAQADCNQSVGQFTEAEDGRITLEMGPTTLAACPEGSISSDYLQALNNANLYFFQDGSLFIDLRYDSGTMQFSPAP